jgi:hypothetical protein
VKKMALSRNELKLVIKELLVEILSEGLGNVQATAARPRVPNRVPISGVVEARSAAGRRKPGFDPRLDTPVGRDRPQTDALREAIKRESGGNSVMANILADTARTTLPTMLSHGDTSTPMPGSAPMLTQQEQFHGAPEEVFGEEVAGRWADLAFAPAKKLA